MANDSQSAPLARFAILFGTPLTRDEFDRRMAADPPSDYLQNLLNRGGDAWEYNRKNAEAGSELMKQAGSAGALVYSGAMLQHLREASAKCHTLILLAHWRGAAFRRRDLLVTPERFVALIESSADRALQEFRGMRADPVEIEGALNGAIYGDKLVKFLPVKAPEALRPALARDLLDEATGGLIAPGNRLELFDGLHAMDVVEETIDRRFAGMLDLCMCNSEALAAFIDLRRRGRIISFRWPVEIAPGPQYVMILDTLLELVREGGSYMDGRLRRFERLARKGQKDDI